MSKNYALETARARLAECRANERKARAALGKHTANPPAGSPPAAGRALFAAWEMAMTECGNAEEAVNAAKSGVPANYGQPHTPEPKRGGIPVGGPYRKPVQTMDNKYDNPETRAATIRKVVDLSASEASVRDAENAYRRAMARNDGTAGAKYSAWQELAKSTEAMKRKLFGWK
jgi:hypothetical protein